MKLSSPSQARRNAAAAAAREAAAAKQAAETQAHAERVAAIRAAKAAGEVSQ